MTDDKNTQSDENLNDSSSQTGQKMEVPGVSVEKKVIVEQPQSSAQTQQAQEQQVQFSAAPQQQQTQNFTSEAVYEKGCVGAALQDIQKSEGYVSRFALLGLIEFIPIFNWFISGYAMRWGRDLIFDKVAGMPTKIFGDRTFANGAMCFLIGLIISTIFGLFNALIGIIPIIGAIVSLAVLFFLEILKPMLTIRMAVFDDLSEGFNLSAATRALKSRWQKVLFIVFIPALIVAGIAIFVIFIWTLLYCLTFGGETFLSIYTFINQLGGLNAFEKAMSNNPKIALNFALMIINFGFSFLIFYLPCFYVLNILQTFTTVLETRAMGHFVARYCNNWKQEPKFIRVRNL